MCKFDTVLDLRTQGSGPVYSPCHYTKNIANFSIFFYNLGGKEKIRKKIKEYLLGNNGKSGAVFLKTKTVNGGDKVENS